MLHTWLRLPSCSKLLAMARDKVHSSLGGAPIQPSTELAEINTQLDKIGQNISKIEKRFEPDEKQYSSYDSNNQVSLMEFLPWLQLKIHDNKIHRHDAYSLDEVHR